MVGIGLCSGQSEVNEIDKVHGHSTFYPNARELNNANHREDALVVNYVS